MAEQETRTLMAFQGQSGRVDPKLADALRQARETAELGQAEVAERLGVTQGTVSHWELARSTPSLAQIAALEKVCRVPKGFVLRLAGYSPESRTTVEVLRTDPDLTPVYRKLLVESYRTAVKSSRASRS